MGITVIIFTIIASILSYNANRYTLNSAINIFVFVLGIRFIVYPVTSNKKPSVMKTGKWLIMQSIIWGAVIGSISGYFGSGGGLSMLAVLTMLLGYNLKDGIGTSVFIMAFAALVGAIAHFMRSGVDINPLVITCIAAFIGANIASRYANKVNEITLNRVVGGFLIIYGIGLILVHYLT